MWEMGRRQKLPFELVIYICKINSVINTSNGYQHFNINKVKFDIFVEL